MIKIHLGRLMGERKLCIADVARGAQLSRKAVTLLYYESGSRVELETIDRLCAFLGCRVSELMEHVPNGTGATSGAGGP